MDEDSLRGEWNEAHVSSKQEPYASRLTIRIRAETLKFFCCQACAGMLPSGVPASAGKTASSEE
ncbi:TPA: hypothetical protein DDW35_02385 [Candidatus Sumerlaeota bacterium]|nr:hypothetical protein [Candidatus Sumerlaeota bacterium]